MLNWTYAQIKAKVLGDLGLEQEEFVTDSELMSYCNEAIDEAEAEIHTIYEDYFLKQGTINLVQGQSLYDIPTDIYANKIRKILYFENNTNYYPVIRVNHKDEFLDILETDTNNIDQNYRYIMINPDATTGFKIKLVPASRSNITGGLVIWYIRNANRITTEADYCDIPEFVSFIIQYMKMRIYEKEGNPMLPTAIQILDAQRTQMISTLTNRMDDGENEIEKDLDIYENMV
jgi:hypothetical protein